MRLFGNVATVFHQRKAQGNVDVVCEGRAFVGFAIAVGVFENHDFIIGLLTGIDVRIRRRAGNPHAAFGIPTHLDGTRDLGELFFAGKEVDFKTRIDIEGGLLVGWGHPFVGAA